MKISVVIPVYNEIVTIDEILRRVQSVDLEKEIIIVDDGSTDGTSDWLLKHKTALRNTRIIFHSENRGKGAALRTGFQMVSGDVVLIQDADLEYDPSDYAALLRTLKDHNADIVYGSRFTSDGAESAGTLHYLGNRVITKISNALTSLQLTDVETCYKAFRAGLLQEIDLKSDGFCFDPEFTMKAARSGFRFCEVGVSYNRRSYAEGKKISWWDGIGAILSLFWYRFVG